MSGVQNLASTEELNQNVTEDEAPTSDALKDAEYSYATDVSGSSQLQTIEVAIDLVKQPGRTLGFSIAGGKGSTPAYEDVDEVRLYENTGAKGMYICTMYMCMM
jgi:hypothetical protein